MFFAHFLPYRAASEFNPKVAGLELHNRVPFSTAMYHFMIELDYSFPAGVENSFSAGVENRFQMVLAVERSFVRLTESRM